MIQIIHDSKCLRLEVLKLQKDADSIGEHKAINKNSLSIFFFMVSPGFSQCHQVFPPTLYTNSAVYRFRAYYVKDLLSTLSNHIDQKVQ